MPGPPDARRATPPPPSMPPIPYTAPMFSVARVSKAFGGEPVLADMSLSFEAGRTTALIGPSGCGKSTLLRLLLGLETPDRGTISFNGSAVTRDALPALRRQVGYVVQSGGLFPHMTARENITLVARQLGRHADAIDQRVGELARLTRFPSDALDRYPSMLSGGQNQRVSLMRALMLDPTALLLDEPLGALDPMIRYELQQELRDVFAALEKTVVLVTHDLAEAADLAHTIVLMHDGGIALEGDLHALLAAPPESFAHRFVRAQRQHLRGLAE
jgi:osmoprotectant transport system ATP-binding protein